MTLFRSARRIAARPAGAGLVLAVAWTMAAFPGVSSHSGAAFAQEPVPAPAQKGVQGGDPVVARVNGADIRVSDVDAAIAELPPQYASLPRETVFKAIVQQLIDRKLLVSAARARQLDESDEFKQRVARIEDQILEQIYYETMIEEKLTDRALMRAYEQNKQELTSDKQVRARHILVKTREEAIDVINELGRGKDFAELAAERSIGPSKSQGGDLGYFSRDQMVAPFADAAFAMKPGAVSSAPVQTQYGWHVIKVEDMRDAAPPTFEESKPELRQKVANELFEAELKRLRGEANVEILDAAAQPEPEAPAQQPQPMPMPQPAP